MVGGILEQSLEGRIDQDLNMSCSSSRRLPELSFGVCLLPSAHPLFRYRAAGVNREAVLDIYLMDEKPCNKLVKEKLPR